MTEERAKRKLSAILSADVKGYSRLMGEDELATVRTLEAYREMIAEVIRNYSGRVVDSPGDNVFAEFASVVDAVESAVEIQKELKAKNDELPENRRMEFRIGINLGDVIEEGERIYGDGVNIAARVENLAEGGGICVSGTVYDQIENKLPMRYENLGEHRVKNIAKPVRVYRVGMEPDERRFPERWKMGAPNEASTLPDKPSIAVLPFDNLSGDPAEEYFADGITEDIITALSKNRWLFVVARNSTFAYKGCSSDVRRIARELGAGYLVEGSVRKAGHRVRITAQLIDGATGNHIWAERYDRDLEDIFALQDEVTGTIAARIEPELGAVERQRAERKPTENLNAWDCHHLGLSHMYRFDRDGNVAAQQLFRRAIAHDPKFAAAHGRLAYCIVLGMVYFDAAPTDEALDEALAIARKAASLDDKDAFSHLAVARVHLARREYEEAVAQCRTSIDLNPTFAQAHCAMGDALSYAGRVEEAIVEFEESIRLSPHDPWRWAFFSYEALAWIFLQRYDRAVELAQAALRVPNCQYWANAHLAAALGHLRKADEARNAVAELLRRKPGFSCRYAEEHLFYLESRAQIEHYVEGLRLAGVPG